MQPKTQDFYWDPRLETWDPSYRWDLSPETRNSKGGIQDPKHGTQLIGGAQDPRPKTWDPRPKTQDPGISFSANFLSFLWNLELMNEFIFIMSMLYISQYPIIKYMHF